MELEAHCALPSFHELGKFTSAVLAITQRFPVLLDLSGREGHGGVVSHSESRTTDEREGLEQIETLHFGFADVVF